MLIENVIIEDKIKKKVLDKHDVTADEIKQVLSGKTLVLKTHSKRYIAIGLGYRHLTIVFEYSNKTANITTAYPSSKWQIKLYKNKKDR